MNLDATPMRERLVFHCRTTCASATPCTPRRMCCSYAYVPVDHSHLTYCFGFRVSGFGFRISGAGFQFSGVGFRVSGERFRVLGFGCPISGFGFRVQDLVLRVSGFRCQISGSGFGFQGSGFRVSCFRFRVDGVLMARRSITRVLYVQGFLVNESHPSCECEQPG